MDKLNLGPRKIFRAPALRRGKEAVAITDRVKLERILGCTVSSNAAFDCDPNTGIVAYPAGCVVVLHSMWQNQQSHIQGNSKKAITSLAFSPDGKYIVTGECGHLPYVRVWDVNERSQVAEFQGHKYGINCVAFSPNFKYVISIGSQHDMIVNVWDWKNNVKIASNKVSCKVKAVAFASNGNYFVTVGNRHVKFWYLEYCRSTKYKMEPVPLMGRSAILGDQRNNYFFDVACGKGNMTESTYAITKSGLLCEFNSRRLLDKWVELRTTNANCISVGENYIFVGCSEGVIRCFSPTHLNFICTLPRPHFLGIDVTKGFASNKQVSVLPANFIYPDTAALALDEANKKVACMYNDHSFYVWDIKDVKNVNKSISFMYHSACIWGIEMYPELPAGIKGVLPKDTFVTFSSDDTIRFWNLGFPLVNDATQQRNSYSMELLKVLYTDHELTYVCEVDISFAGSNDKVDTACDGKNGVRCLKISPNGKHLASGDRTGNIRIHDLELWEELCKIEAHDSEVLCLEYSKPILIGDEEKKYLTSASRDRLIHVFDVNNSYSFQETLDDHSSSITAVRFVLSDDLLHMISCGADKSIIFRKAQFNPSLSLIREHHVVGKTTLYDMEVDEQQNQILTACQDRNIRMYSILTGKHGRCFRGSQGEDGTLIKVVLDPSGSYIVTSCTDKSLYLYDYLSGECLATMHGHSELVTGLTFTNDGQNLISVSGDGCIFVWRLPFEISQTILNKRMSLDTVLPNLRNDQRKSEIANSRAVKKCEDNSSNGSVLSDPYSSISSAKAVDPTSYRFSMGPLPLWAKKQMNEDFNSTSSGTKATVYPLVASHCRWAHRIDNEGLVVKSYLESDSIIPFPNSAEKQDDSVSTFIDKVKQEGKDEGVIYRKNMSDLEKSHKQFDQETGSRGPLQVVDVDQEQTDSEAGVKLSFPNPADNLDMSIGTFPYPGSEGQKENFLTPDIERRSDSLQSNATTHASTPDDFETNSEDEDVNTPLDSDKSLLSYLCVSSENLERLGQREIFMKNNYESLSFENCMAERNGIESNITLRHSLSRKFLSGSSPFKLRSNVNDPTQPFNKDATTPSERRNELNKSSFEAKRKLEAVGFRPRSSVSICDLYSLPCKTSSRWSRKINQDGNIRRAASMNDISTSRFNQGNFSVIQKDIKCNAGGTGFCGPSVLETSGNGSALYHNSAGSSTCAKAESDKHVQSKEEESSPQFSNSVVSLHSKSEHSLSLSSIDMSSLCEYTDDLGAECSDTFSSCTPYHNNVPVCAKRTGTETVSLTNSPNCTILDISSFQNSATIPTEKSFLKPIAVFSPKVQDFTIPKNSALLTHSTNRTGAMSKSSLTRNNYVKTPVKGHRSGSSSSKSSLESSSPKLPVQDIHRFWNQSSPVGSLDSSKSESFLNSNLSSSFQNSLPKDPMSVPLTKDLCHNIAENLNSVALYTKQIFQRVSSDAELSPEERNTFSNVLFQGIWHAQQTLFSSSLPSHVCVASSSNEKLSGVSLRFPELNVANEFSDKSSVQKSSSDIESKLGNIETVAFLEDLSDKLLSIIEKKMNKQSFANK